MQDKTLTCLECGNEFIFSADEQEFYSEFRNLKNPKDADHVVKNRGESVAKALRIKGITDGEYLFK